MDCVFEFERGLVIGVCHNLTLAHALCECNLYRDNDDGSAFVFVKCMERGRVGPRRSGSTVCIVM